MLCFKQVKCQNADYLCQIAKEITNLQIIYISKRKKDLRLKVFWVMYPEN